ncbi:unnamed protein product [Umbelopsis ramanniana]
MVQTKPFGSWTSPITAESLGKESGPRHDFNVIVDPTTNIVYWTGSSGEASGRVTIFSRNIDGSDERKAILPEGYNCRTRAHEYGGGAFTVYKNVIYFSNIVDDRLYKMDLTNGQVTPIVPENPYHRYADMAIDQEERFIICVREEHFENETPNDVINTLVAIDLLGDNLDQAVKVIAKGNDFYISPRLNPDSSKLAYITWNHPNMPWDFTQLNIANVSVSNGVQLSDDKCVVGDKIDESIMQPRYASDGTLYVMSDRSGFWNLYKYESEDIHLLLSQPFAQEFGGPTWNFGQSDYRPFQSDPTKLICKNKSSLAVLDVTAKTLTSLPSQFRGVPYLSTAIHNGQDFAVFLAVSSNKPTSIVSYNVGEKKVAAYLEQSRLEPLDDAYISVSQEISFPTKLGDSYCFFYPPKNPEFQGDGLPPLIVLSHGGPTASVDGSYNRNFLYWTSRGFAIADVNYGGSSGYGREYRNRLHKNWGVVDVDDCCEAALYLAEKGYVDREKLSIKGASAGGYTTLASLTFRPEVFKAGCSLYGISDITLIAIESHKFESRYIDNLIGQYPRDIELFRKRSPIHYVNNISCPVILFQGLDDKVVPPSQAEVMLKAMNDNKVPNAYVSYEGESHGFRQPENIIRTLELEQWFYGQIFGFPVEGIEGVEISNYHK